MPVAPHNFSEFQLQYQLLFSQVYIFPHSNISFFLEIVFHFAPCLWGCIDLFILLVPLLCFPLHCMQLCACVCVFSHFCNFIYLVSIQFRHTPSALSLQDPPPDVCIPPYSCPSPSEPDEARRGRALPEVQCSKRITGRKRDLREYEIFKVQMIVLCFPNPSGAACWVA